MSSSDMLGVVLAGGGSRRMGRDKARLGWAGATLAERAAAVLGEVCDEVVVAGPPGLSRRGLEAIADLFPGRGPLAGIHAGLERANGRPVLVLACDLPLVPAALMRHLVMTAGEQHAGAWAVADGERLQPACGLYGADCRVEAERRLAAGRPGLIEYFRAVGGRVVPLTPELAFYAPELLLNLNRPRDLERARRLAAVVTR